MKLTKTRDVPVRSANSSESAASPAVVTTSSSSDADAKRFTLLKDEGNDHFKAARYKEALRCYSQCCILDPTDIAARSNRAFAYLKLNKYADAEHDCSEALTIDPKHVKSLFRRATARKQLGKPAAAIADCQAVVKLEPANKAAKDLLAELEKSQNITNPTKPTSSSSAAPAKPVSNAQRTKLVIQETDSDDDDEPAANTRSQQPAARAPAVASSAPIVQPPRLPRSAMEFESMYREFRHNSAKLHALLSVIQPSQFPTFLRTTLDSAMLSKIIDVVTGDQMEHKSSPQHARSNVLILASVSEAERFELIRTFLSNDEKINVAQALDSIAPHVKSIGLDDSDIAAIKQRYS